MDSVRGSKVNISRELFPRIFKIAKEGKLLSLICNYVEDFPEDFKPYLEKRCLLTKFYYECLRIVAEELNSKGVEYYIIKTIKPFAYDMTDLDLLIIDGKEMLFASKILVEKHGFKPISKGTYSISLRKIVEGLDIDLDLQTRIAAGTFEYIVVSDIKKQIGGIGYIKDGLNLLRPELELCTVIGHAFYKDLTISLANILHARFLLGIINRGTLSIIFDNYQYLVKPFKLLNTIINLLQGLLYTNKSNAKFEQGGLEYLLISKSVYETLEKGRGIFNIPLTLVASTYMETANKLIKGHRYHQLEELLTLPHSRGIALLFRRMGVLPPEETIRI